MIQIHLVVGDQICLLYLAVAAVYTKTCFQADLPVVVS